MESATLSISHLEELEEKELEAYILSRKGCNDARFVLGKLMIEGSSSKVKQNENKGLNWLKEAAKAGHIGAIEYKTYHDIRFDRKPNVEKITGNLNTIIEKSSNSARACNTLGEFSHAQASSHK
jgi:TPR repeat protein